MFISSDPTPPICTAMNLTFYFIARTYSTAPWYGETPIHTVWWIDMKTLPTRTKFQRILTVTEASLFTDTSEEPI